MTCGCLAGLIARCRRIHKMGPIPAGAKSTEASDGVTVDARGRNLVALLLWRFHNLEAQRLGALAA